MKRKWLAFGVILLFIGACIIPAAAQNTGKQSSTRGNWLYVGGNGPGNYSRIQDAVDDASDGDTVYVYSGTYTSVMIHKYISLQGENKSTTIIDATGVDIGISILGSDSPSDDWVNISGFTIKNANMGDYRAGIFIANYANPIKNINIFDNIITQNSYGIVNFDGVDCQIYRNIIRDNTNCGLDFLDSRVRSYVTNNFIMNNYIGIQAAAYEPQIIEMNQIAGNDIGIDMAVESENIITHNNFINNVADAEINGYFTPITLLLWILFFKIFIKTKWSGNYWDEWNRRVAKPIVGFFEFEIVISLGSDKYLYIPLGTYPYIRFDWHPAQEPYDIPG